MKIAIFLMALGVSVFVGAFVPENALGYEANWSSPGFVDSRQVCVNAACSKSIGLI